MIPDDYIEAQIRRLARYVSARDDCAKERFCPFCGSDKIKFVGKIPRCMSCRTVFIIGLTRKMKQAPCKRNKPSPKPSDSQRKDLG